MKKKHKRHEAAKKPNHSVDAIPSVNPVEELPIKNDLAGSILYWSSLIFIVICLALASAKQL